MLHIWNYTNDSAIRSQSIRSDLFRLKWRIDPRYHERVIRMGGCQLGLAEVASTN
jgi:hypothetical protein